MLNKAGTRELAYLVRVEAITPMNADRLECAHIGGWHCVVGKGEFKVGDPAVYFEIDSQLPDVEPFSSMEFLKSKHFKIKSQKIRGEISQGLLMPVTAFGWEIKYGLFEWESEGYAFLGDNGDEPYAIDQNRAVYTLEGESRFLTQRLGVTYADPGDNSRKAPSVDKYKKMAQRHPNIFKRGWVRWLMKRTWGKKLLFVFFGRKRDKKNGWPSHIAARTDVERVNNMIWVLNDKKPYVASEKVDGSSFSAMAERGKFGKIKYYVCSRSVVFDTPDAPCFYDSNIYFEAWDKYNLREIITAILKDYNLPNVAIQAEVYGDGVQKRDYSLHNGEHKMAVFHIVSNGVKFPMDKTIEICEKYGLPHVPIVNDNYILPDTIDELQEFVEGAPSKIDGKDREGIVFYDKETGQIYFKFVSPEYLLKYHG